METASSPNPLPAGFMGKVQKSDGGCWEWTGCIQGNGYGRVRTNGRTHYTHRLAYEHFHGEIPPGNDVCHRCDNRRCCNPDHLFTGTRLDNMKDAKTKGRVAAGEQLSVIHQGSKTHLAKLVEDDVIAIRRDREKGASTAELAERFSVSVDNIRRIVRRNTWRHI